MSRVIFLLLESNHCIIINETLYRIILVEEWNQLLEAIQLTPKQIQTVSPTIRLLPTFLGGSLIQIYIFLKLLFSNLFGNILH